MTTECVDAFVERAPKSLLRLNIAGCRKSLNDNRKFCLECPVNSGVSNSLRFDSNEKLKKFSFFTSISQMLQIYRIDVQI